MIWSWVALAAVTIFLLWVDLHFFARGREPSFREGVIWSIGWLVLSLLAGATLLLLDTHGLDDFVTYLREVTAAPEAGHRRTAVVSLTPTQVRM